VLGIDDATNYRRSRRSQPDGPTPSFFPGAHVGTVRWLLGHCAWALMRPRGSSAHVRALKLAVLNVIHNFVNMIPPHSTFQISFTPDVSLFVTGGHVSNVLPLITHLGLRKDWNHNAFLPSISSSNSIPLAPLVWYIFKRARDTHARTLATFIRLISPSSCVSSVKFPAWHQLFIRLISTVDDIMSGVDCSGVESRGVMCRGLEWWSGEACSVVEWSGVVCTVLYVV
jgi:hypothetical protein